MRTFIVTRNGIARVLRTYAFGRLNGGHLQAITPGLEGIAEEKVPAPAAEDVIAKWVADAQAEVTSAREITEVDIPTDTEWWAREGWEDNAGSIIVNITKVKAAFKAAIIQGKRLKARDLLERETMGEDVTAEKNQLKAIDAQAVVDGAATIAALKAAWPAGLEK